MENKKKIIKLMESFELDITDIILVKHIEKLVKKDPSLLEI